MAPRDVLALPSAPRHRRALPRGALCVDLDVRGPLLLEVVELARSDECALPQHCHHPLLRRTTRVHLADGQVHLGGLRLELGPLVRFSARNPTRDPWLTQRVRRRMCVWFPGWLAFWFAAWSLRVSREYKVRSSSNRGTHARFRRRRPSSRLVRPSLARFLLVGLVPQWGRSPRAVHLCRSDRSSGVAGPRAVHGRHVPFRTHRQDARRRRGSLVRTHKPESRKRDQAEFLPLQRTRARHV